MRIKPFMVLVFVMFFVLASTTFISAPRDKSDKVDKVRGVAHVDNSARLQTVTEKLNPWFHNFLKLWNEKSGVPILLQTSQNENEPVVNSPEHAIKTFIRTGLDFLYFYDENILVTKKRDV